MSTQPRSTGRKPGSRGLKAKFLDRTPVRLAFLLLGGVGLLAGVDAALLLLGLHAPVDTVRLAQVHGPLMVFGFVGTVVVLERAVATRRWWAFFSPGLFGLGGLAIMSPLPLEVGEAAFVVGSFVLVAIYAEIWRKQTSTSTAVQALGAVLAVMATVLWLGGSSIPQIVPPMALFLILTIGGERLELARISPTVDERAELWLFIPSLCLTVSAVVALLWPVVGYPLLGVSMLGLVLWLFRYDVATKLIRSKGLPRYMAICLLVGYVWLVVAGAVWLTGGPIYSGPPYDAVLHSVFLGFVISMIMAHAPTILPAVLRRPLPYRPVMYVPVVLLHGSLLLRTLWGDARGDVAMVQWGGVLNIVALLLFVLIAVVSVLVGVPKRKPRPRTPAEVAGGEAIERYATAKWSTERGAEWQEAAVEVAAVVAGVGSEPGERSPGKRSPEKRSPEKRSPEKESAGEGSPGERNPVGKSARGESAEKSSAEKSSAGKSSPAITRAATRPSAARAPVEEPAGQGPPEKKAFGKP